ncbi:MAG TPA: Mut7-C RNAse domain-containing protein, partial [Candidatus Bathyarchaeia archaeon]|nr:Mut7-C RNAse domain-containing protein [Candidatus Bathyarchaeia archaeon]
VESVLVLGDAEDVRLAQLVNNLGISLEINMSSTRCPECGSTLSEISKDEAANSVPAASLRLYDRFWRCTNISCTKTYWVGSHWKRIRETLEEARKISNK